MSNRPGTDKPVILIVDDEPDLLDLLAEGLKLVGAEVVRAINGMEGWQIFNGHKKRIDLVICDIYMPEMNGVQLLGKIKQADPELPFILITGYIHLHTLVEESKWKPNGYLEKPFCMYDLYQLVSKHVSIELPSRPDITTQ